MKNAIIALTMALLSGCASLEGQLENRLACALAKDELMVISKWGKWIGIATVVAERDRPAGCR